MSWNPAFLLQMPNRPWMLDATQMGVTAERLDELAWSRAFSELELLESGALVNASEYRQVGHYWLRAPERAPTLGQAKAIGEAIEAVRAFAAAVRTGA